MDIQRWNRLIPLTLAIPFAGIGLAFWIAPEQAAKYFDVEAVGTAGLTVLRADLGGLFVGLAALCVAAAWTQRRAWCFAAVALLAAIVIGRSIGWLSAGRSSGDIAQLGFELLALAALLFCARFSVGAARASSVPHKATRGSRGRLVAGLSIVSIAAALSLSSVLQQRLFDRAALKMTAASNTAPLADDALRVAICGSSAPLPSAHRAKACVAVFAGGKFYVVDAGPESVENLVLWGIPLSEVGGVLLTHFHSDHIGDLGELNLQTWAAGRPAPLAVYGGPGVEEIVDGFNRVYRLDQGYRTAHHSEQLMPAETHAMIAHPVSLDGPASSRKDRTGLVFEDGGLRITAIEVDHAPIAPAYAYRFDYKGRSVVITGDLKYHPPLAKAARDVDVLVSEAIAKQMTQSLGRAARSAGRERTARIMHDIEDYHITPEEAAQSARPPAPAGPRSPVGLCSGTLQHRVGFRRG